MATMDEGSILQVLRTASTIAVVGCSPKPERDSHRVAAYLQRAGYRIVPINPGHREILEEPCYPSVSEVPQEVTIDVVDVFRRPEAVPEIVEETIDRGVPTLWLQLGVAHNGAEARARSAGVTVISDRCLKVEHAARRDELESGS
jgi:hypothetical protein